MKTREERRAARAQIEEERRRVNGERAYRDWLLTSKNKPLPVPLNQGELSEFFLLLTKILFHFRNATRTQLSVHTHSRCV